MEDSKDKIQDRMSDEEVPVIIIERVGDTATDHEGGDKPVPVPQRHVWRTVALCLGAVVLLALCTYTCVRVIRSHRPLPTSPVLPVSTSSEQQIAMLETPARPGKPRITVTEDSINGCQFRMYELKNLRAELCMDEPSASDRSVYFYAESADYRADNHQVLDACVIGGQDISTGDNRSGYFAALGNQMVIGVAQDDSLLNYIREQGGHFFRQFALVSDCEVGDVRLRGVTQRRALARRGDILYYIEGLDEQTIEEFATAISDYQFNTAPYGFTDAIYMKGGTPYSYYRDSRGRLHAIGQNKGTEYPRKNAPAPYLVMKKRK